MVQKANYDSIMDAAMRLAPEDRCRVATSLWESVGPARANIDGDDLEEMLNRRETELNEDPSGEISHEEFMAAFTRRRSL